MTDSRNFSFDQAIIRITNLDFIMPFKKCTYVKELEEITQQGIIPNLKTLMHWIGQMYSARAKDLVRGEYAEIEDAFKWIQPIIA